MHNNGRGGSERAFFLRAYTGGPHIVDRVSRGIVSLNNLLLTVCGGGIQPDRLASFKDLMDDGLWQRLLANHHLRASLGVDEADTESVKDYTLRLQGLVDASSGHIAPPWPSQSERNSVSRRGRTIPASTTAPPQPQILILPRQVATGCSDASASCRPTSVWMGASG